MLSSREKAYLLYVARGAIINRFIEEEDPDFKHPVFETDSDELVKKQPVFVSLYSYGMLRGSHGHFIPYHPLLPEVYDQAYFAAFKSSTFAPLQMTEIDQTEIVISVLTKPCPTKSDAVVIGQHGIMVKKGTSNASLLLPHVALRQGFTVDQFWSHCCEMAGLKADVWHTNLVSLLKFEAQEFSDHDPTLQREMQVIFDGLNKQDDKSFKTENT